MISGLLLHRLGHGEDLFSVLREQDVTYMPPEVRGWMDAMHMLSLGLPCTGCAAGRFIRFSQGPSGISDCYSGFTGFAACLEGYKRSTGSAIPCLWGIIMVIIIQDVEFPNINPLASKHSWLEIGAPFPLR